MVEASLDLPSRPRPAAHLMLSIGWRNLWRNRRRTWLTAGGIAFAIFLVVFGMSFQHGVYSVIENNASTLLTGHIQIQTDDFIGDSKLESVITDATRLMQKLEQQPGVLAVAPRVEMFALASSEERSFGALLYGVDIEREQKVVRFFDDIDHGRLPQSSDEVMMGIKLASNLGVQLGGELVILGTAKEGGVAALVYTVVGIFESGIIELDRNIAAAPIESVRAGFNLGDEVHTFAIRADEMENSGRVAADLQRLLPDGTRARAWDQIMPEIVQGLTVDRIGGRFMYMIIIILVSLSIVNSFIMTIYERTREFGMLKSIGMRPAKIIGMVQIEALCIWLVGTSIGVFLASVSVWALASTGVSLGQGMEDYVGSMYLPSVLYPALNLEALATAPGVLLIGTQLAALIPSVRIRHLKPVDAMRSE
jgi:ABC-type lipoprotein release transport system permease subunit